jgi:hypothetical protein
VSGGLGAGSPGATSLSQSEPFRKKPAAPCISDAVLTLSHQDACGLLPRSELDLFFPALLLSLSILLD